jgi:hypothetical protein
MPGQPDSALDQRVEPDLISTFAALQSLLLDAPNLAGFLDDVARLAAGVVPSASCGALGRLLAVDGLFSTLRQLALLDGQQPRRPGRPVRRST